MNNNIEFDKEKKVDNISELLKTLKKNKTKKLAVSGAFLIAFLGVLIADILSGWGLLFYCGVSILAFLIFLIWG
jgi:hypothetical protein